MDEYDGIPTVRRFSMTDATDAYHAINWAARVESLTAENERLIEENGELQAQLQAWRDWGEAMMKVKTRKV